MYINSQSTSVGGLYVKPTQGLVALAHPFLITAECHSELPQGLRSRYSAPVTVGMIPYEPVANGGPKRGQLWWIRSLYRKKRETYYKFCMFVDFYENGVGGLLNSLKMIPMNL